MLPPASNETNNNGIDFEFVNNWVRFAMLRGVETPIAKNWSEITAKEIAVKKSNIIPFTRDRKPVVKPAAEPRRNRELVRLISNLVIRYCIDTRPSLMGFYAFLRDAQEMQVNYASIFSDDSENRDAGLIYACDELIMGFWLAVRDGVTDYAHHQEDVTTDDVSAIYNIQSLSEAIKADQSKIAVNKLIKQYITDQLRDRVRTLPTRAPRPM